MKSYWGAIVVALSVLAMPAMSQTVELQQGVDGYEGTADTHIISYDGNQNQLTRLDDGSNGGNGGGTPSTGGHPQNAGGHYFIEQGDYSVSAEPTLTDDSKVILIKFDLAGVSVDSVNNAQIGLYYWFDRSQGNGDENVEGSGGQKHPHNLYVNRILKEWIEGDTANGVDGTDAADNSGAVTWNSTGIELWQAIGVEGPEDIAPTESVTYFEPEVGGWVWFDVTESVALWLADPSSNHGVKIGQEMYPEDPADFLEPDLTLPDGTVVYRGSPVAEPTGFVGGAHNFVSSENDMADLRPKLVINPAQSNAPSWDLYN